MVVVWFGCLCCEFQAYCTLHGKNWSAAGDGRCTDLKFLFQEENWNCRWTNLNYFVPLTGVLVYRGYSLDEFCNQCYGNAADRKKYHSPPITFCLRNMLQALCLYLRSSLLIHSNLSARGGGICPLKPTPKHWSCYTDKGNQIPYPTPRYLFNKIKFCPKPKQPPSRLTLSRLMGGGVVFTATLYFFL